MSDKIYPVLTFRSEGQQQPSAPPIGLFNAPSASTLAIQMPAEKAIHREQEKSLISPHYKNSTYDQRFNHGQPSARISAAGGHRGGRSRQGCCCCCLASFVGTLAATAVILGLAVLVLYLVLKPKTPKFSVTQATVNDFKLRNGPPPAASFNLHTDVVFSIEARNSNKKISLSYTDVAVTLLYSDQAVGQGSIPAFEQSHQNITLLTLLIQADQAPLTSSTGAALQSSLQHDDSVPLQAKAVTKARVKIGRWRSRRYKIQVVCSFELSDPSSSNARVKVLSKSSTLKLKIAFITLTF